MDPKSDIESCDAELLCERPRDVSRMRQLGGAQRRSRSRHGAGPMTPDACHRAQDYTRPVC